MQNGFICVHLCVSVAKTGLCVLCKQFPTANIRGRDSLLYADDQTRQPTRGSPTFTCFPLRFRAPGEPLLLRTTGISFGHNSPSDSV